MSNWETAVTLLASTVIGATGAGAAVDLGATDRLLRQTLDITAATGAINVSLECAPSASGPWKSFASYAQAGSVSSEKVSAVSPDRYVRVAYKLTSGSVTLSVSGTKGTSFANLIDLAGKGSPMPAMVKLSTTDKAEQLAATTEVAAGILSRRYTLPITAWGGDITLAVVKIATYELLATRGYNPDGDDDQVRKRYEDAMAWLRDVADGTFNPIGLVDSSTPGTDTEGAGEAFTVTFPSRGWR
jgi:phage gp36-like protein